MCVGIKATSQSCLHQHITPPPSRFQDQFATSWSAVKGHHLFCWEKTEAGSSRRVVELEESKECISPLG